MRMRIATLSLLTICCLMLAVAPATAGTLLYENGPYNGTNDAWTINFGFSVSDSYTNGGATDTLDFVYWDASMTDVLTSVDVATGTSSFGGTPHTYSMLTNTFISTNQYGYFLFEANVRGLSGFPLTDFAYMTLSNACTTSGCSVSEPIYWDENSGIGCHSAGCPSSAYENTVGSIPSEAFTLTRNVGATTPEPSSIMLFGSGILGLAGILRRRLNR